MAKGKKEVMWVKWAADFADLGCWWLVFTGECVIADVYQELLGQNVVPWAQRMYPDQIRFSADSAPAHTAMTTQQLLAKFWTPVDWPSYLLDLNPLDLLSGSLMWMPYALRSSPQNRTASGEIHPQGLLLILPLPGGPRDKKWCFHWEDEQPTYDTHQQYFPELP